MPHQGKSDIESPSHGSRDMEVASRKIQESPPKQLHNEQTLTLAGASQSGITQNESIDTTHGGLNKNISKSPSLQELGSSNENETVLIHGVASVKDLQSMKRDISNGFEPPEEFTKLVTRLYQKNAEEGHNNAHTSSYLERVDQIREESARTQMQFAVSKFEKIESNNNHSAMHSNINNDEKKERKEQINLSEDKPSGSNLIRGPRFNSQSSLHKSSKGVQE